MMGGLGNRQQVAGAFPSDLEMVSDYQVPVYSSNAGNSLPNADEILGITPRDRRRAAGRKVKTMAMLAAGLAVIMGVGIGFSRAGAGKRKNLNRTESKSKRSFKALANYILDNHVSSKSDLNNPSSPQFKAVTWMVDQDKYNWTLPVDSDIYHREGYAFILRYVLTVLYYATDGDNWPIKASFLTEKPACDWTGFVLDSGADFRDTGIGCGIFNTLPVKLMLSNNTLGGTIPTEIGLLSTLQHLEVEFNNIKGSIPTELCKLTMLRTLLLGANSLSGSVPSCLGEADGLKELTLNDNLLGDELPQELSNLLLLKRLFLDDNKFSGNPTGIFNQLIDLELLMAQSNAFTGVLDENLLAKHKFLTWVDFSDNQFSSGANGAFPTHLLSLQHLEVLDLSSNSLAGSIPDELQQNQFLRFLSLRGNKISGPLPSSISNLVGLHHLDLSDNELTGDNMNVLSGLNQLRALYLGENLGFAPGPIPSSFDSFSHLQDLSLRESQRTGPLPISIGSLKNLKLVDLGNNDLDGEIPAEYGNLEYLEFLMLNHNANISGPVPGSIDQLNNLRAVFLDGTGITGSLDATICALQSFLSPDNKEVAYADCMGSDSSVECDCCRCCVAGGCSTPFQNNLRASWVKDFSKLEFQFTNATSFFDRSGSEAVFLTYHHNSNN